jgi:hypothetical protein
MKKSIVLFVTLAVLIPSGLVFGDNNDHVSKPVKVSLQGMVIDKDSKESLAGVTILIDGKEKSFYTDTDGKFTIDELTPGTYTMKVKYISYQEKELQVEAGKSPDETVSIPLETVEP